MIRELYKLIGILRCPYLKKCGPDVKGFDFDYERDPFLGLCFTRRHKACPDFINKQETEEILLPPSAIEREVSNCPNK